MPSENYLRAKAKEYLTKEKYQVWFAPRVRWAKETDIFSCFDCQCWRRDEILFVQITTLKNWRARQRKITDYMLKHGVYFVPPKTKGIVMAWSEKKEFRIFDV